MKSGLRSERRRDKVLYNAQGVKTEKLVGTQSKASKRVASQGWRKREGRTKNRKEARYEPPVRRSQFYKIRVSMVRWFIRSELRLISSREDEQDRAIDHRSLEDVVVVIVVSHGTDHCVYVTLSRKNLKCLQSCDPADTGKYICLARGCGPTWVQLRIVVAITGNPCQSSDA